MTEGIERQDDLSAAIAATHERYRIEREKRLRADGPRQWVEVDGDFARFAADPFTKERPERAPRTEAVEVVIVGGGFGGLLMSARLDAIGITDTLIVEDAADFGGTWYWNRYPGAQCDIESYVYMPLLEEIGTMPREKYAYAEELFEHSRAIGRRYELYDRALFQTCVTTATWDEERCRWTIRTDRGDELEARVLILATGGLTRPKLPGIPGIQTFEGHMFHTSRWDYDYTGGGRQGDLVGLEDKHVGIIGTGATAVQVVPRVAEAARHLYVFQRTPSSIDVRNNRPTDEAWFRSQEPGWQRKRTENFSDVLYGRKVEEDLVADAWTDVIKKAIAAIRESRKTGRADPSPTHIANFEKMNEIRQRVESLVEDSATAEALKPWYDVFCKRPCFHDEFLQSFNRKNVTLVDTDGKGVEAFTAKGPVVAGREYEIDCLIFATGFEVGTPLRQRTGLELFGVDGVSFSERWSEGPRTLHGIQTRGFPNCFNLGSLFQSTVSFNVTHVLTEQSQAVAAMLDLAKSQGCERIEVSAEAEEAWSEQVATGGTKAGLPGQVHCTPGYYNNEGQPKPFAEYYRSAPGGPPRYYRMLREWCEAGCPGLEFSRRRGDERTSPKLLKDIPFDTWQKS